MKKITEKHFFDYYQKTIIPNHIRTPLYNYFIHGIMPGGFLTSLLSNDLFLSVQKADPLNLTYYIHITTWILHNMPDDSYGSYEIVNNWCANKNDCRTKFIENIEMKIFWKNIGQ